MKQTPAQKLAQLRYRSRHHEKVKRREAYYRATHSEEIRQRNKAQHARRLYNMTINELFTMFEDQGYSCAVCGSTDAGYKDRWHVDHDHKTGHVRGILCCDCNTALKQSMTPAVLRAAIEYLEGF